MTTMLKMPPVAAPHPASMTVNSVRLAPDLEARLAEAAGRLHLSKSDVIRQALVEFLDTREGQAAVIEFGRDFECGPGPLVASLGK
ncbi:MAG TPA: ribbon-helix-helix protein, CopG family [Moraxellaceae bacterium]|nr:ribbon-helix-helix protein, CopG family [Moraxellaceae bacterium]